MKETKIIKFIEFVNRNKLKKKTKILLCDPRYIDMIKDFELFVKIQEELIKKGKHSLKISYNKKTSILTIKTLCSKKTNTLSSQIWIIKMFFDAKNYLRARPVFQTSKLPSHILETLEDEDFVSKSIKKIFDQQQMLFAIKINDGTVEMRKSRNNKTEAA